MSKRDKTIKRLLSKPVDFEWGELRSLMEAFGYELKAAGGSGRKFMNPHTGAALFLYEPHPSKVLLSYQVKDAIDFLKRERQIP